MSNYWNSNFEIKPGAKRLKRSEFKRVPGTARLERTPLPRSTKPMNKLGKKGKAWMKARRQLNQEYEAKGITSCELRFEGCWGNNANYYAHGRKRRHLKDDELKTLTILACNPCHDRIEYLGPEKMLAIVQETIAERKKVA